jgi:ferredoxin
VKVSILDGCIACGACEALCPEVFTVYDNAEVNAAAIAGKERQCRAAAEACPVSVIHVQEV